MENNKITVLLAEDHKLVRKGIRSLLELDDQIVIVGEAKDGIMAVELVKKYKPMVVLMDVAMPVLNGLEATKQIVKLLPEVKVIILSAYSNDNFIDRSLNVGACGYLVKQCSPALLVESIKKVLEGELVFSPSVEIRVRHLNQECISHDGVVKIKNQCLSDRELQVLQLIAEGKSNRSISIMLKISIKTVDKHRQNLMKKLMIHDTAGLTRYAISQGIIENNYKILT
jgi:DNA-binding NarL/FixJ family response regulator